MHISHSVETLDTPEAWVRLARVLGGRHTTVINTIRHLRVLGTKSYVVEEPYIDRDYSTDYVQFYARTFRAHDRHCKRVHFFSRDVTSIIREPFASDTLDRIAECATLAYCGFCVVRPLSEAPIGRTVLLARLHDRFNLEATVTCRANFDAHLLGVKLQVTGAAFLQQDTRVGACAQVAIWAGMRHMHARHNYNWVSVADITRLAGPPSVIEAVELPNASDRLSSNAMVRAIAEAGYQPLVLQQNIGRAILPYVESGIPVILGLNVGGTVGHALTVVGRVFARLTNPTKHAANYVPAFVVHDDQSGPYRWLPSHQHASAAFSFADDTIKRATPNGPVELNVKDHAIFAIALMSTRVFCTAARAEHNAWSQIDKNIKDLRTERVRKALAAHGISVHEELMGELDSAHRQDRIVLRTYLTSAAGYRRHLVQGSASDALKHQLLRLHLPHFTWITEISTIDSYNQQSPKLRRIYGHTVLDATSTANRADALLVLHLPGLLIVNNPDGRPRQPVIDIANDKRYECREKRL